ncbi:DgyrCDS4231 [Dimorphilus gyrociliatus]|nr:DgyrCDS4231 [Dimorphilus gyrociliatus]
MMENKQYNKFYKKIKRPSALFQIVIVALVLGSFVTFLNIYELRKLQMDHLNLHIANPEAVSESFSKKSPVYWIFGKQIDSGYLDHVMRVLERVGYVRGTNNSNWDLLWAHDYPFGSVKGLDSLKSHQMVNKFPGSGWITNKLSLATSNIKQAPKAFKIPSEKDAFFKYAKKYPLKKWVQKSNNHRGIRIRSVDELDFSTGNTFVQEYIDNPYLIDGKRFDIGIYTTLVSVDPLRVYIFDGDWLMRYCAKDYYPFDAADVKKYVVGDDYTPTWKMPSLKKAYTDLMFTHRESFFHFVRSKNDSVIKLTNQIHEAIRNVYISKVSSLIRSMSSYGGTSNFFEMVRFDFVVDKDLNVYLMEVNMSPNLSTAHFSQNRLLYEQVLYSMFSLTGVAKTVANNWIKT